jgi:MurNAc alpha-1-phosphate uridylyltransferase
MILAAGRGERMRPLTDTVPKAMLEAGGKPLIVWIIERLARAGIRELVINHAHLGGHIEAALGNGSRFGVSIRYSVEHEALETAGGIAQALPLLGERPFIASAADLYSDYDFSRLTEVAFQAEMAHLVLVPNPAHNPRGDFALDGSVIRNEGQTRLTFSGIGVYHPRLFAGIPSGQKVKLAPLLRKASLIGQVSGELHTGMWRDIGTPERLAALRAELAQI